MIDALQALKKLLVSTTVHVMTKSFLSLCSAKDGESADMNCLVFWEHCKMAKF